MKAYSSAHWYMDPVKIDTILDLLTLGELGNAMWYIRVWERAEFMEAAEADEWRRRIVAWQQFV